MKPPVCSVYCVASKRKACPCTPPLHGAVGSCWLHGSVCLGFATTVAMGETVIVLCRREVRSGPRMPCQYRVVQTPFHSTRLRLHVVLMLDGGLLIDRSLFFPMRIPGDSHQLHLFPATTMDVTALTPQGHPICAMLL